jgi:glc operon protein GlcG
MSLRSIPKAACLAALAGAATSAQTTPPAAKPSPPSAYATPIGASVSLENAKKAATAAASEARKNGWFMAIAVVDPAGTLVYYEKADTTQLGSAQVAIAKARSAALYKRPTKAFQDALEKGGANLRVLALEGAVPVDGGVPLMMEGKLIGAIGVSGDLAEHDGQCAHAGAAALTPATVAR